MKLQLFQKHLYQNTRDSKQDVKKSISKIYTMDTKLWIMIEDLLLSFFNVTVAHHFSRINSSKHQVISA